MEDLLAITDRVMPVVVIGEGLIDPVGAYTDGHHFYSDDANATRVGEQLTGRADLAGRPVRVQRTDLGWQEMRGETVWPLHRRHIDGHTVYQFDTEWLFTVAHPLSEPLNWR